MNRDYLCVDIEGKVVDYYDALMYTDKGGYKIYNGRIRWLQQRALQSETKEIYSDESETEDDETHHSAHTEEEKDSQYESEDEEEDQNDLK